MVKYDDTTFTMVKDKKGEKYLCPIDTAKNRGSEELDMDSDCIEVNVVGRYAGNLKTQ
jgi:hypothetical protein